MKWTEWKNNMHQCIPTTNYGHDNHGRQKENRLHATHIYKVNNKVLASERC